MGRSDSRSQSPTQWDNESRVSSRGSPLQRPELSLLTIPSDRRNAIQADCDVFMRAPDLHREEPACSLLRAGEADWGRMYSSRRRPEPCEAKEVRPRARSIGAGG